MRRQAGRSQRAPLRPYEILSFKVHNNFGENLMKRIYSAPVLAMVENVKNVLELNGVKSTITNQYLSAGVGELPPIESWPQLWVEEEDVKRASEIIRSTGKDLNQPNNVWVCPKCKEEVEEQFTECWNCGTARSEK
jgi:hypothetical protein